MPPPTASSATRREEGTASVELVAAIPFLLLAALVAVQLAMVGQAIWSAAVAARAGARAELVGGNAAEAARATLPSALRRGADVETGDDVRVEVPIPRLLPLPQLTVGAGTSLGPGGG
jgi:hypothetical protein